MTLSGRRKPWVRILVSLLMAITAVLGLVSGIMSGGSNSTVSFNRPTATHTGYVSVSYTGDYHYVLAQPLCRHFFLICWVPSEIVFYLTTENAAIRLVFYCGLEYCDNPEQLPFHEGARIYVKGTLIQPSDWPTTEFQPVLQFMGDLYVFSNATA